tara:strand:+ start:14214 stop:14489 length:276 start_codon:yes stop_codon:yes gene_type:complete
MKKYCVLFIFFVLSNSIGYSENKEISVFERVDRILEPSPNGTNISYIPFDPNTKATLFVIGLEIPMAHYFTVTLNIVFTTYDKNNWCANAY